MAHITVVGNVNRTHYRFRRLLKVRFKTIFPNEHSVVQGAGRTDAGVHAPTDGEFYH